MADLKEIMKSQRSIKIELGREEELEEIYEMMNAKASDFKMPFKLKKGILGKRIEFDKERDLDLIVSVTVKDRQITVRPIVHESKTMVGTGNMNIRVDKNSVFNKGVKGMLNLPAERAAYLESVAETIRNILT